MVSEWRRVWEQKRKATTECRYLTDSRDAAFDEWMRAHEGLVVTLCRTLGSCHVIVQDERGGWEKRLVELDGEAKHGSV